MKHTGLRHIIRRSRGPKPAGGPSPLRRLACGIRPWPSNSQSAKPLLTEAFQTEKAPTGNGPYGPPHPPPPRNPVLMSQDGHRLVPLQFETLASRTLGFGRFGSPGPVVFRAEAFGVFLLPLLLASGSCREACVTCSSTLECLDPLNPLGGPHAFSKP